MLGVWFATLMMDSRHAGSLVYYLSDGFKACWESLVIDSRHAGSP